jgi:NAD(P)H-dependent FMN reductase
MYESRYEGKEFILNNRHLSIPVILGTTRKGRMSAHAARFMVGQIEARSGVTTELIDISELPMPIDDAGDSIKDPMFSEKMAMADGLVIVTPEYNHSFPGLLKHVLDSCLKEYIHKPAGIVGV